MIRLCEVAAAAAEKLPPAFPDKSGVGVHYVDAFLEPLNATLPDGTKVACRRRGLRITLTVGERKGEGLMRRLEIGADPVAMLRAALQEAARAARVELEVTEREVLIGTGA